MENASKALLIAASVLIAVVLIAFGIRILTTVSEPTDELNSTMNTSKVAAFNNKYTQYVGTKNKAQVASLLNVIIANNATNAAHKVQVNGSYQIATKLNNLTNGNFTVTVDSSCYNNASGYLINIKITTLPGNSPI